jgi:hypothetical protein
MTETEEIVKILGGLTTENKACLLEQARICLVIEGNTERNCPVVLPAGPKQAEKEK